MRLFLFSADRTPYDEICRWRIRYPRELDLVPETANLLLLSNFDIRWRIQIVGMALHHGSHNAGRSEANERAMVFPNFRSYYERAVGYLCLRALRGVSTAKSRLLEISYEWGISITIHVCLRSVPET